jgi:2-polyprenyl-3-methyl-5-hydroxy-6-metoxy-1,4-benzoquinol methylase
MTPTSDTPTDARRLAACWACGADSARDESWLPAELNRCPSCGLLFAPERTAEPLQDLYADGYYEDYPGANDYLGDDGQRRYDARRRVAFIRSHGARGRLLEIGTATGHFLTEAHAQGFEVVGVDPDEGLARRVAERTGLEILPGFVETVELPEHDFDAICAWHVLEHLFTPRLALERLASVLAPGGRLFLEVPNISSVLARRQRMNWLNLDIEHHVSHFNPASLRALLERAGFEVELMHTVSMRQYLSLRRSLRPLELAAALRELAVVRSGPRSSHPSRHEMLRAVAHVRS